MNEWDGTPWAGQIVLAERSEVREVGPPPGAATVSKAAFGPGLGFYQPGTVMLSSLRRSPQKVMREAQALYHSNAWVGVAERAVTRKVAGLPWHLEDANDDEIDDATPDPVFKGIRDLLETPQSALPPENRQPAISSWRSLIEVTSRHAGLCGVSYWYPDQPDVGGRPLAILYVNPARVFVHTSDGGNVLGYSLDAKDDQGRGGLPLRLDELIPFYLEVPDFGHAPSGLVEGAALKASITNLADAHAIRLLGSGGRLPGILSPKDGYINDAEQFNQLVTDLRNAKDSSRDGTLTDAVLRGPVDFTKTGADPAEMSLLDLSKMNRDDILAVWGVPPSQAGVGGQTVGLNSGETRRYEYQILMQGPVHDRVTMLRETIQYQLLDRWTDVGKVLEIEIEEPDFDDDAAPYELAAKAANQPLTNNDRRAILKLDPWPDYGPDGEPLGLAIVLPTLYSIWGQGPEENGQFDKAPQPEPPQITSPPTFPQLGDGLAKASPRSEFLGLRKTVDKRITPALQKAMQSFLDEQRADIATRVREKGASIARKPNETSPWWRNDHWDKRLASIVKPHIAGIAQTVTGRAKEVLGQAKADPFSESVEEQVLSAIGKRIGGINETTRDAVASIIRAGITESLTASEIASRIEALPAFDAARAELVARTESGFAYNTAAVSSYREYGVERVQVIDGDGDEICAPVNGKVWTLEEANDNPLGHPHCTRDFAPYLEAKAEPVEVIVPISVTDVVEAIRAQTEVFAKALGLASNPLQPIVNNYVSAPEMPDPAPVTVTIEKGAVQVAMPESRPVHKTLTRTKDGWDSIEEPA